MKINKNTIHLKQNLKLLVLFVLTVAIGWLLWTINQNQMRFLTVSSGSMEPAIPVGSLLITKTRSVYSIGQVITYADTNESLLISHRITDVYLDDQGLFFLTKGDANDAVDSNKIRNSAIIGAQDHVIPYAGYIVAYLQTSIGFILFVVVPGGFLISSELIALFNEFRKLRSSKEDSFGLQVLTT